MTVGAIWCHTVDAHWASSSFTSQCFCAVGANINMVIWQVVSQWFCDTIFGFLDSLKGCWTLPGGCRPHFENCWFCEKSLNLDDNQDSILPLLLALWPWVGYRLRFHLEIILSLTVVWIKWQDLSLCNPVSKTLSIPQNH